MATVHRPPSVSLVGAVTLVGAVLVILGSLLLLDRLGVEAFGVGVAAWWPAIVVALGVRWLWRRATLAGAVATVGGVLLLAATTGAFDVEAGAVLWPAALILAGILLLRRPSDLPRHLPWTDSGDAAVGVLSNREWSAGIDEADGASLVCVLGEVDVTLAGASAVAGRSPVAVSTVTILGETEIRVPAGWRVTSGVVPLLGELRLPPDQPADASAPQLRLSGVVVLGECTVRRVAG